MADLQPAVYGRTLKVSDNCNFFPDLVSKIIKCELVRKTIQCSATFLLTGYQVLGRWDQVWNLSAISTSRNFTSFDCPLLFKDKVIKTSCSVWGTYGQFFLSTEYREYCPASTLEQKDMIQYCSHMPKFIVCSGISQHLSGTSSDQRFATRKNIASWTAFSENLDS